MSASSISPPDAPPATGPRTGQGRRPSHGDLVAGGIFVTLGLAFVVTSLGYGLGSLGEMSTGMFPFINGVLLTGLGTAVVVNAFRAPSESAGLTRFPVRGALCVLGGLTAFALSLPVAGLLPATFLAAFLSSLADPANPLRRALLTSIGITVASWVIFVLALQVRVPIVGS